MIFSALFSFVLFNKIRDDMKKIKDGYHNLE